MNIKEGNVNKSEVARLAKTDENEIYRATHNDRNKPLAHHWEGVTHPETGKHLDSDYELHKGNDECIYAQFSDKQGNSYHYVQDSEKTVDEQVYEDRELANKLEQDRGR